MENVIEVKNLSKRYKIYKSPYHRLMEWASLGKLKRHDEFWALKDISFELKKGQCLGIIGVNGAGKSTLLKILSGAIWPSSGLFRVNGKMVSLLELGTGFHPELSGIDNIMNSGKLLGFSNEYLTGKIDAIVEFSELGDFIHQPVKNYSSGMYVRLAFSMYANLEPDIYVVDEALSVGDIFFQQKCFNFLNTLMDNGTSIILVTHDMQTVLQFCDNVILLKDGKSYMEGHPVEMVNLYYTLHNIQEDNTDVALLESSQEEVSVPLEATLNISGAAGMQRGNGKVEILGVALLDHSGKMTTSAQTGEMMKLVIYAESKEDVADLTFAYQFTDRFNTVVFGQNSYMVTKRKISAKQGEVFQAIFEIEMSLYQGLYTLAIGASDCQTEVGNEIYTWIEGCLTLEIVKPEWRTFHGVAYMKTNFQLKSDSKVYNTKD
ncbi:ABC transporter ATP-binding protein [Cohnella terricola]|uniref:ABC transporter ATP-binding protein n=1 Tax=Cohnella terricola TaxID=1289167 RepID=A0A559JB22_9BACL|nr:ABC transporter ATP-binding protein [Cohnella terricola]TVX97076.1 ABC transporter ATP-binding protein [Cohnella terricola]